MRRKVTNVVAGSSLRMQSGLSPEGMTELMDIAVNGRDRKGCAPRFSRGGGAPRCHHCHHFYPKARTTAAGVVRPHLCCSCTTIAEEALRLCRNGTGRSPHLACNPSGSDDNRSGRGTKY